MDFIRFNYSEIKKLAKAFGLIFFGIVVLLLFMTWYYNGEFLFIPFLILVAMFFVSFCMTLIINYLVFLSNRARSRQIGFNKSSFSLMFDEYHSEVLVKSGAFYVESYPAVVYNGNLYFIDFTDSINLISYLEWNSIKRSHIVSIMNSNSMFKNLKLFGNKLTYNCNSLLDNRDRKQEESIINGINIMDVFIKDCKLIVSRDINFIIPEGLL